MPYIISTQHVFIKIRRVVHNLLDGHTSRHAYENCVDISCEKQADYIKDAE